jgi:hypothetical protein
MEGSKMRTLGPKLTGLGFVGVGRGPGGGKGGIGPGAGWLLSIVYSSEFQI